MIVLDTNIWIGIVQDPERLSLGQQQALEQHQDGYLIASISLWEVSMSISRRRLETDLSPKTWLDQALLIGPVSVVELTPAIASESVAMPDLNHKDPPPPPIVAATARVLSLPLLTNDAALIAYQGLNTIE